VRASEWLAKAAAQGQRMAQQNLALLQQQTRGKLNARAKGSDKCDEVIKCLESGRVCR